MIIASSTDERIYYPLHAKPYTPASYFPKGRNDPGFATKLRIAADLVAQARCAEVACRAVVADCFYGDHDDLRGELRQTGWGWVMALKPHRGTWDYRADTYTPVDAARAVSWNGPDKPGSWSKVDRRFRDGHTETWWATDAELGWWGPDGHTRLVVATKDPATLPDKATWYLATNLPRPGGAHDHADSPHEAADLAEVVRLYGIRQIPRSAVTKPWSTARSRSAGTPGSTIRPQPTSRSRTVPPAPETGVPNQHRHSDTHAGPKHYAKSAAGSPHGSHCGASGTPGRPNRHPLSFKRYSTPSRRDTPKPVHPTLNLTNYR